MNDLLTRVLLATDGSKDAALAARAAADVCEGTSAELHVVHAWHTVPTARLRAFMRAELKRVGQELLEKGMKQAEEAGGRVADVHLVEGRTADEILRLAGEIGARLIVIGSRGLGTIGRIALGSVSEGIVHNADCPVLVLRGGEGAWPPERVVFGDDGSEAARAAGTSRRFFAGATAPEASCCMPTPNCRKWTPKAASPTRGWWTTSSGEPRRLSWSGRRSLKSAWTPARRSDWWWARRRRTCWRPRRSSRRRGPFWPWAAGASARSDA